MLPGLIADFDAAQPLHPHIAFPAGNDDAERIALLGPERFAVHAPDHHAVLERFLDRDRARHACGVGAFHEKPFRVRANAGLIEHRFERDAGVHDVVHHAVRVLAAVQLRAAPLHAAIRRAFEEIDAVHPVRETLQILEREDHRLFDQAVDHQAVLRRIDFGDAAVMTLETKSARRDDAVELMERREIHRRLAACRQPFDIAPHDMLLERRRRPVGARGNAFAEIARPVRNFRDRGIGLRRRLRAYRYRGCRRRTGKTCAREETAAVHPLSGGVNRRRKSLLIAFAAFFVHGFMLRRCGHWCWVRSGRSSHPQDASEPPPRSEALRRSGSRSPSQRPNRTVMPRSVCSSKAA